MRVVAPLDPLEGQKYIEPMFNEGQGDHLEHIYNVTIEFFICLAKTLVFHYIFIIKSYKHDH